MSEYLGWACTPDGRFDGCDKLATYWSEPGKHAFMLRADTELAGFALVRGNHEEENIDYSIGEFFVLRKFRRRGAGESIACQIFDRFRGRWKVSQLMRNTPAIAFWRAVIGRYTSGEFRECCETSRWGERNVILFRNDMGRRGSPQTETDDARS
jgi:predicted acetyltransferase